MGAKITVIHEIASDKKYCSDGDSGGWRVDCKYRKQRDKTGKRGEAVRRLPRCTLFETWLESDFYRPVKCAECLKAMSEAEK